MAKRECDGTVPGRTAECRLRNERVDDDERSEEECEHVDDADAKRQPPLAQRVAPDAHKRNRKQDLLPRGDRGQRPAAHARFVERSHDGVVQRKPDDEEEERRRGPPPDEHCGAGEEHRVEGELQGGHRPTKVQRADAEASARR